MSPNPIPIQTYHHRKTWAQQKPPEPLFLIHDGGGTVFSYFLLEQIGRTVYGISNPHFGTESTWENGIASMAGYYARLIKKTCPSGDMVLGGWSLGGIIAIQIAQILASDSEINVTGIVMIDSTFPVEAQRMKRRRIVSIGGPSTSTEMVEKARKCMIEAHLQVRRWKPPTWRSCVTQAQDGQTDTTRSQNDDTVAPICPPAILIRAANDGTMSGTDSNDVSGGEAPTDDRIQALGFDKYENFNLRDVLDTPGDHFSIFNTENVNELSKRLKEACDMLENKS